MHGKDVSEEQLKVVVYSGDMDLPCESDFPRAKTKVGTVTREAKIPLGVSEYRANRGC